MPEVEIEKPADAPASEPASTPVDSEKAVEKKIEARENLGVIEDIKKTINEIRQGVRSNIASLWVGFKNLISKGFDKLFGIEEKPAESKPAENSKPSDPANTAKAENPSTGDSTNPKTTQTDAAKLEAAAETPKLEEFAAFKKVIETYAKEIKGPLKNVLYPASGLMSINEAFKESKVTYVDTDENAINAHKKAGHTAVKEDMENYNPTEKPDLTILLNPQADDKIKKLLEHVEKDKHVICNNQSQTAKLLHGNKNFELVGVINADGSKMDKEKLEDYFKQVETDEEFKQTDPAQYEKAVAIIKEKKGDPEKDILKQFKELTKNDTSGLYRIPLKKGVTDNYFIFKRTTAPEAKAETTAKPTENKPKPTPANSNPTRQAA